MYVISVDCVGTCGKIVPLPRDTQYTITIALCLLCEPGVMHFGPVGWSPNWHHPPPRAARNSVCLECSNLILKALTSSRLTVS